MKNIILENKNVRLEFNRVFGTLVGLKALESDWKILSRPHLGLSFRLMVPLPNRHNNPVFGEKQKVSSYEVSPGGRKARFHWDGVRTEHGGLLEIKIIAEIILTEKQAIFAVKIENNSDYTVENVYYPYLGDLQHPPNEEWFKTFQSWYGAATEWSLWPIFQNLRGYYGVDYPTQFSPNTAACGAPTVPFILLRGAKQGLYVGITTPSSELVAWHLELRPGYGNSINAQVPKDLTINGKDVTTRFSAVHVPYIQAKETRSLTPVCLKVFQGSWQKGVDIYKKWRNNWMKLPTAPSWTLEPHSWQQIHVNSPEDELRIRYSDLIQIGEDCVRHGVKAIQLVGWTIGGQDQGNPSHDIDPRLGTFEELKEAISKIQSLGVKVILFSKFTWADLATERFRRDLKRLAIKDPYGDPYQHRGYQYQTATQLLGINTKRLVPMCFLNEEYLQVCEEEFQKMIELGPDGILFDECVHHTPALLCFDTSHGHRYGAPVYSNDRKLIKILQRLIQPSNNEFLFAGEGCYDWEFEVYHLSYHRSSNMKHIPLTRYMLPDALLMTAVTGFNDRNMINQCLMYRYIVSYEPYNFKGRLDDFPLTVAYGKQMEKMRRELREYFWDGEFHHELGAIVTENDRPYHPYGVFINHANGKKGVVVANYDETENVTVKVTLDNGHRLSRYCLVDNPKWKTTLRGVTIPPYSAAVVID